MYCFIRWLIWIWTILNRTTLAYTAPNCSNASYSTIEAKKVCIQMSLLCTGPFGKSSTEAILVRQRQHYIF